MSRSTLAVTPAIHDYLLSVSLREPEVLKRLRDETEALPDGHMQIAPEQGAFMALLVELMGATRALEIGVYTGYSALVVALAMGDEGRITACDVRDDWTRVARRYWREAGVDHKIELHLAPARDTLERLIDDGGAGTYDFAFIDADKREVEGDYERVLALLRPGGLAAVDNVLWKGRVADVGETDPDTVALRRFNAKIRDDDRVTVAMVPIGDGVTLLRKR